MHAIQQMIAHVGLSAPHDGAQLKTPTHHFPLFYCFLWASKVPKAGRVYSQARGAGMTTPAWCCRRQWRVPKPKSMAPKWRHAFR